MAEPSASESSTGNDSDQDFDPSADMLVNDFDDEHTLDEEEAIDDAENEEEIDDLEREGEMPIEQLLALYGYGAQSSATPAKPSDKPSTATASTTSKPTTSAASESNNSNSSSLEQAVPTSQASDSSTSPTSTANLVDTTSGGTVMEAVWRLPSTANLMEVDDEESDLEDEDYEEEGGEDWRRTIQVGSDYQAQVPDGLCKYDDVPAYENEDSLLWDPTVLHDKEVEEYLRQIQLLKAIDAENNVSDSQQQPPSDGPTLVSIPDPSLPLGCHIRDDQQALYLLHQCGHKTEEALRRRRMQSQKNGLFDPMTSWSEEECRNFEEGLRIYGKDFYLIQKNKVRTRSVGELVQFYYYWKKTERHDVFASKWRIEKKKYSLHPGTTDYMDRFLDEQENLVLQSQTITSAPNVQSLRLNPNSSSSTLTTNPPTAIGSSVARPPPGDGAGGDDSVNNAFSTTTTGSLSNGIGKAGDLISGVATAGSYSPKTLCPSGVSSSEGTIAIITEAHLNTSTTVVASSETCK